MLFTCAVCGYTRKATSAHHPMLGAPRTFTFEIEPWARTGPVQTARVTFPAGTPICHLHQHDRQALASARLSAMRDMLAQRKVDRIEVHDVRP